MDFNVKGITFNADDVVDISLDSLTAGTICRHHLFYSLAGGKKVISLLHAGDLIDSDFIQKYKTKNIKSLSGIEVANESLIQEYKLEWGNFKQARSQRERMQVRDQLLEKIKQDFLILKNKSFLSYVIACYETFFDCPDEVIELYQQKSVILYTRSLMMSAKLTCLTIAGNYLDFHFIKDFYNTAFLLDYGLVMSNGLNYTITHACELERSEPTSGVQYLKDMGRSSYELDLFLNHPIRSHEYAQKFEDRFSYPELLDFIKLHHEKGDGSGFPNGYFYAGMGRTEGLLAFCDYLIPFTDHIYRKNDGPIIFIDYFENLKNLNTKNMLPIKTFVRMWQEFLDWSKEEMGVAS